MAVGKSEQKALLDSEELSSESDSLFEIDETEVRLSEKIIK